MKKGMVYVEAIISSLIAMILIVSISKLIFTASKILKDTREKGRAIDIVRGVGSLYKANKTIILEDEGIVVNDVSDIYAYIDKGVRPSIYGDFTLYAKNSFEEGIEIIKIKIISNESRFKDISVVVTKL